MPRFFVNGGMLRLNRLQGITNLLLTGPPGCGKSTLIIRLVEKLPIPSGGFTTAEIRTPKGEREGFLISSLSGKEGILAHREFKKGPRVGRYRVNTEDLDRIGSAALESTVADPSTGMIVIDEIARMELCSPRFRRAVILALDSPKPLLGTIQIRRDPFLDSIRNRKDTSIISIKRGRLEEAERCVLSKISSMLKI